MYRLVISFLLACTASFADQFSIRLENDLWGDSDRHYTHGTRVQYTDNKQEHDLVYAIGQYLYTPSDIKTAEFQPDDRPYGAWLYFGLGYNKATIYQQDYVELQVGTVGPNAQGEEVQTTIHEWTNSTIPMGWEYQIENEIGINVHYYRKYRMFLYEDKIDYIPQLGGSLGNIYTGAYFGGLLRLGYKLPNDFGLGMIEPGVTKQETRSVPMWKRSHIFGKLGGRAVLRNIFLDGNTFKDSHRVDREDMVGECTAGFKVYVASTAITMAFTWRSKEFTTQQEANQFASANIEFNF